MRKVIPTVNRREFAGLALAAGFGASARRLAGATAGATGIDETLRSGIASRKIPAVVGMVANERKTLYENAFGVRDSSGTPVHSDSIFAIASMTKAVTTVAALQLVEQGRVHLDEPVAKFLPQLGKLDVLEGFGPRTGKPVLRPARVPITLKHLLTHTSGFCYDIWDRNMFQYGSQMKNSGAEDRPGPLCSNRVRAGSTGKESIGPGVWWKP